MTNEQKDNAVELHNQGLGYKRIAKELGLPVGTIISLFNRIAKKENTTYCLNCGLPLKQTKGHRQKIFCSKECSNRWWYRHPEQRNLKSFVKLKCESCGVEFEVYGNRKRKYCSRKCYLTAYSKNT